MWKSEYRLAILYHGRDKPQREPELYIGNGERKIMLLAMHYSESKKIESDTNRINAFLRDNWSVCSVDLSGYQNSYGHISANFATKRGIKKIIKILDTDPSLEPTIIALDYFWLQNPIYYRERYGEDWPEKSQMFFKAFDNLIAIILPIDDWTPSSMKTQMKRIRLLSPMTFFTIEKDDVVNPLVYYTLQSNDKNPNFADDRSHEAQKWRISGFVVLHRDSMSVDDVKRHIKP
tara:strand:- start:1328 stop:2026 length:699 start_codon:yes stop_codon:yes gene_type:complete